MTLSFDPIMTFVWFFGGTVSLFLVLVLVASRKEGKGS